MGRPCVEPQQTGRGTQASHASRPDASHSGDRVCAWNRDTAPEHAIPVTESVRGAAADRMRHPSAPSRDYHRTCLDDLSLLSGRLCTAFCARPFVLCRTRMPLTSKIARPNVRRHWLGPGRGARAPPSDATVHLSRGTSVTMGPSGGHGARVRWIADTKVRPLRASLAPRLRCCGWCASCLSVPHPEIF